MKELSRRPVAPKGPKGLGQLTLVEHALCPLNSSAIGFVHRSSFNFINAQKQRQTAIATVTAPFGLLPSDEFFLWGLLGLTSTQPEQSAELYATPHFILRHLGCIDARSDRGGSAYRSFRESLRRLAAVHYHCDGFYDPRQAEHREASFGFLSFSLPLDPSSSRAWRIVWDPLFFEFCSGAGRCLSFDLKIYRTLDPASRRLYLFLSKIFWRREWTHWIDLQTLAVKVLGFSSAVALRNLKQKVKRAIMKLRDQGILHTSQSVDTRQLFVDRDVEGAVLRLRRGSAFRQVSARLDVESVSALPFAEPLRSIGLDDKAIAWAAKNFRHSLIQQWADITLAAKERHGQTFFKKSAQAYFINNLREAAENGRTPPDWWWACKREEEQSLMSPIAKRLVEGAAKPKDTLRDDDRAFVNYLRGAGRLEFETLLRRSFADFQHGGMCSDQAHKRATEICLNHLRKRFFQDRLP